MELGCGKEACLVPATGCLGIALPPSAAHFPLGKKYSISKRLFFLRLFFQHLGILWLTGVPRVRFLFRRAVRHITAPRERRFHSLAFARFLVAQPVGFPVHQGLTWVPVFSSSCLLSSARALWAVHFPPTIYRSTGSAPVLPDLVKSLDIANVQCIQFVPNGTVHVTFKESAQCDAALASGVSFRGSKLTVAPVDTRTRLVYVRDLPAEVLDEPVSVFHRQYGNVHSLSPQFHPGLPAVKNATLVAKVTLLKDLPTSVRIAGFDVRLWYQGQPQPCPVCRQFGHRVRDCPLNGLCRQCRQPGHMARECSSRRVSVAPSPAPVSGAEPPMSAADEEDQDYVYFSASQSDVHSDEEEANDACSGDEELLRSAALVKKHSLALAEACAV